MGTKESVADTTAGRVWIAVCVGLVIAIGIVALSKVEPLPENCRMVGKARVCEEPSSTPTSTLWRTSSPYRTDFDLFGLDE